MTAACALRAPGEDAISSFVRDVRPLRSLVDPASPETSLNRGLALRGHGVTGLAGALRHAVDVLATARAAARRRPAVRLPGDRRSGSGARRGGDY